MNVNYGGSNDPSAFLAKSYVTTMSTQTKQQNGNLQDKFLIEMNDLKIIYFCTFVISFTIGNLLILLSYKPRGKSKVKLLLAFVAFNILSFLLMKVYCKREMKRTESSPLESF